MHGYFVIANETNLEMTVEADSCLSALGVRRGRALGTLFLVLAGAVVVGGCPPPPGPDGGTADRDGGSTQQDGGNDSLDAGDDGTDAGPVITVEERAEMLCLMHRQGERNAAAIAVSPPLICDPNEARSDSAVSPAFALDDPTLCLPTKPLFQRYLGLLQGGNISVDWDAVAACQNAAQMLRAAKPNIAENAALLAELTAALATGECQDAVTGLIVADQPCTFGLECSGELKCEPVPPESGEPICTGPAAAGESCAVGADGLPLRTCAEGSTCFLDLCAPPRQAGQNCGADQPACAAGLVCGPDTTCVMPGLDDAVCNADSQCAGDRYCQGSACKTPVADGAPCASGERCEVACSLCRPDAVGSLRCQPPGQNDARCSLDVHCLAPRYCADIEMATGLGTCTTPAQLGAVCDNDTPCAAGLTCRDDVLPPTGDAGPGDAGLGDAGIIMPPVDGGAPTMQAHCFEAAPVGAPCSPGTVPCLVGICFDGTCVAGVLDDPCLNDNGCGGDLLCEENMCVEPPREGAPCSASGRCDVKLYCADTDRCRVFPPAGEMCAPGARCDDDAYCVLDLCEAKKASGAVCASDAECSSDLCLLSGLCAAQTPDRQTERDSFLWLVLLSLPAAPLLRRRQKTSRKRS